MMYESLEINVSCVMMYTKSFTDLYVINDFSKYNYAKYRYDNIVFANLDIKGGDICNDINDINNLVIINSKFSNSEYEYTIFDCKKVIIKNCIFENFYDLALRIYDCEQLRILECKFFNCIQDETSYANDSATLLLSDINSVKIDRCKFENCQAIPDMPLESLEFDGVLNGSTAIARMDNIKNFRLENCKFKNCISNKNVNGEGKLFMLENTECRKGDNCITENCCDIGDKRLGKW